MSYHGKIQTLLKGNADAEIQKWAAEQLEKETNAEPVAWLHIQGNYSEARDRPLDDWEIENGWEEKPLYTTPQTKPLGDDEIPVLTILHNAQSVPLGDAIYETDKEYEKLKKIVIASIKWAIKERILGK